MSTEMKVAFTASQLQNNQDVVDDVSTLLHHSFSSLKGIEIFIVCFSSQNLKILRLIKIKSSPTYQLCEKEEIHERRDHLRYN
jgi:hypothetical protein